LAETSAKTTVVLPFSDFAQQSPQPPLAGFKPEPFPESQPITFIIPSSRRRFKMEMTDQIRVGRPDTVSGILPELNLADDDAAEMGVSRMHAVIQASNQGLVIIDLGSTNGTLLNNSPLSPQLPYPLRNGDEIRFGDLLVHILF
jgi:pSer/pThr/pTyr-binding forkhead associated (FHA) protein